MCVIIAKPIGATVSDIDIESCWEMNDDGAGIAWAEGGKVYIEKGFMDLKHFKTFWSSRDWTTVPALLHFRIATHGEINEENCHPFWVHEKSLAFAHNGVFWQFGSKDKSDTVEFNNKILRQIPKNFVKNSGIRIMLEDFCGKNSKIAFINGDGIIDIVREEDGYWMKDGCWYSNLNHTFISKKVSSWASFDREDDDEFSDVVYGNVYGDTLDLDDMLDIEWLLYDGEHSKAAFILGSEEWYCYSCLKLFSITEVEDVDADEDNIIIPRCPHCATINAVYPRHSADPRQKGIE